MRNLIISVIVIGIIAIVATLVILFVTFLIGGYDGSEDVLVGAAVGVNVVFLAIVIWDAFYNYINGS